MLRRLIAAGFVMLFCVGLILADTLKGTVTAIDTEKKVLTVTSKDSDNKDVESKVRIGKDTKLVDAEGKEMKIDDVKKDATIVGTFEEKDVNGKKRKIFSEVKVLRNPYGGKDESPTPLTTRQKAWHRYSGRASCILFRVPLILPEHAK